jgi:HEAT repeat protein
LNRPLIAGLVIALGATAWLFISRTHQHRLYGQTEGILVAAMKDTTQPSGIRVFAAKSLGDIGPEARGALEPLLEALHDSDAAVRVEAARAIGRIGIGDAYLMAGLRKIKERDEHPQVRTAVDDAIKALSGKPSGGTWLPYAIVALLVAVGGAAYWVWKQATSA